MTPPFGSFADIARRCAARRAYHEARLRAARVGDPAWWSGPSLRSDRSRSGRLPHEEDGGGPSWDDAVRLMER